MSADGLHLKVDGINEAVCEVRFSALESPERVLGRLADAQPWRHLQQNRLPTADIPAALRSADPNLKYQASFEIQTPDHGGFVRIGQNALSIHQTAPYRGWVVFRPAIEEAIRTIYDSFPDAIIERVGLRYINLLNEQDHLITTPHNLLLEIKTGDNVPVRDAFVVNYRRQPDASHICQVAVATPEYAAGPSAVPFSVIVDVDVFTPALVELPTFNDNIAWIERAHSILKEEFFALLRKDILQKLKRD